MDTRAEHLVASLNLRPHPEGGFYSEIYRSAAQVQPLDARDARSALTTIYFLLTEGDVSRWHRVASDEAWHYYEGAPLELWVAEPDFSAVAPQRLGPVDGHARPVTVVPAGDWQAARSTGTYTLVGCTVGPGFEFADFEMLRTNPALAATMAERDSRVAAFI